MGNEIRLNDDADDDFRYDIDDYDDDDVDDVCEVEEKTERKSVGNRPLAPNHN